LGDAELVSNLRLREASGFTRRVEPRSESRARMFGWSACLHGRIIGWLLQSYEKYSYRAVMSKYLKTSLTASRKMEVWKKRRRELRCLRREIALEAHELIQTIDMLLAEMREWK
jgi:hypothetical protein